MTSIKRLGLWSCQTQVLQTVKMSHLDLSSDMSTPRRGTASSPTFTLDRTCHVETFVPFKSFLFHIVLKLSYIVWWIVYSWGHLTWIIGMTYFGQQRLSISLFCGVSTAITQLFDLCCDTYFHITCSTVWRISKATTMSLSNTRLFSSVL